MENVQTGSSLHVFDMACSALSMIICTSSRISEGLCYLMLISDIHRNFFREHRNNCRQQYGQIQDNAMYTHSNLRNQSQSGTALQRFPRHQNIAQLRDCASFRCLSSSAAFFQSALLCLRSNR